MMHGGGSRYFGDRLRLAWPLRRTMLFVGGVGWAVTAIALYLPLWAGLIPVVLLAVSLLIPCTRRPLWLLGSSVVAVFWLLCGGYRSAHVLPLEKLAGQTDTVSGWVESVTSENGYILRVTAADSVPEGARLLLYCSDLYAPSEYDSLTATVQLEVPGNTLTAYRARGVHLLAYPTGYTDAITVTGKVAPPLTHLPQAAQRFLAEELRRHLPGDEGALLAALCLGEQHSLPEPVTVAFRDSGVAHLLVVSGLHISLMTGCVLWLLRRLGLSRRAASAATIPFVLVFMPLVGLTAPVLRAGIMSLVWLCGRLMRRRADGMNSLGLSTALLVLYNPYMAVSASFLLSFSATAGVLCLTPRLLAAVEWRTQAAGWLKGLFHRGYSAVAGAVAACVGAMAFLLPFLCVYFNGFPLVTLLTNLLTAIPSTGALLAGWLGVLLCVIPGLGWLGQGVLLLAGLAARCTVAAAALCGEAPLFIRAGDVWQVLLVTGVSLTLAVCVLYRRRVRRRILAGLLALSVLTLGVNMVLSSRTATVTVLPTRESAVMLVETPAGSALLVTHSDGLEQAVMLVEDAGCTHITYVLLGEGESPHAGHLARLLRTAEVEYLYSLSSADWTFGCDRTPLRLVAGSTLSLPGFTLATPADDCWQLQTAGNSLLLCTGGAELPEDTAVDWAVFVGGVSETAANVKIGQSVLLGEEEALQNVDLTRFPAAVLLLPDQQMTLAAIGEGEWSLQAWP